MTMYWLSSVCNINFQRNEAELHKTIKNSSIAKEILILRKADLEGFEVDCN